MGDNPAFHQMPDRPILNLDVARRGLNRHQRCSDGCEAKRYFTALVPYLERGRTTWNIWTSRM
ncbi:hypothetical protein [Nocardia huaxiensis]|uniref:hypothetical protein n=1 Tax=Nocardia huaxiensis TaxID=2755382 RepID=UPI001E2D3EC3|nr:hypothetical protein [Nocardia huaxiensis]UFS99591.1 hypothetical protein LPY97_17740 [Nocardia huaxiensis]